MLRLGLLSQIAERVTFVLIPPLALIFLVLGTIFIGVATPTEGGAMGAVGAIIMAVMRKRLSWSLLRQAMDTTSTLSCFVRSEEHTSELQSLMRISYAVFCLK